MLTGHQIPQCLTSMLNYNKAKRFKEDIEGIPGYNVTITYYILHTFIYILEQD